MNGHSVLTHCGPESVDFADNVVGGPVGIPNTLISVFAFWRHWRRSEGPRLPAKARPPALLQRGDSMVVRGRAGHQTCSMRLEMASLSPKSTSIYVGGAHVND